MNIALSELIVYNLLVIYHKHI